MEEIKPKKERKFLKVMGDIALTLFRELVLGIGKKVINKVGNKRQGLVIAFLLVAGISYASIDSIPYPVTGNKQRLGWQTSGNGLVYRGRSNDTITKPSSYVDKNVKAYLLVDSVRGTIFVWRQTYWDSIKVNTHLMPFDSITFNTAKNGTVGVGEVEYNDTQGSLIQGLKGGNVTNVIGQQLHQRVNNRTGAPLAKGDVVYLAGSQGNRITVAKGLAVSDAFSANTFGVVAESIADNQSGFIITEGLITGLNTSALTEDSAVYLSPTVAGALTSTKPQAPQHTVYIGVCVKSNNGSGELFVKIRNGQELDELHDTRITNPVSGATLYYSGGLWRDTTAALLVSDTASMLANYATKAYADTTGRLYARQDFTNVSSSTLTWTQNDTLIPGGVNVVQVYRNGQILLPSQYTIPTSTSVVIAASSFKVNDNYTVIFPRGGGAGSGGGSGSLTSISAGTGITVSPNPITTTGTVSADLSVLMELNDTSLLNLTTRFASKLNTTDTASLSNRINAKGNGTVTSVATGYGLLGGTITTTGTLVLDSAVVFSRIRDSIVDVAIGNDTIKILKQEYAPATTSVLTWTVTPKFPIQLKQYILVFRNGQLLINDQYNLTDTNKITIVSNSFKVGANYTVVTVSGIGSVGTGTFPNPVYPEAGIALSTGTTWASSIPNNSSNWNTAFTDRLKWDGGSTGLVAATGRTSLGGTTIGQSMFTLSNPSTISFPRFNADNTITSRSAANFRNDIGAGTVTSVNVAAGTPLSIQNNTTIPEISMLAATGSVNGYLTSTDWNTFNNKQNALGFTPANSTITINTTSPLQGGGNLSANRTLSILSASDVQSGIVNTSAQLFSGSKVFKHRLTADSLFYLNNTSPIPTAILGIDLTGGVNSVGKFTLGNGLSITSSTLLADTNLLVTRFDTASMLTPYFRDADTSLLNLTSRFAAKLNISDTTSMFTPYFRDADTSQLNLTSRFNTKLNLSDTASMLTNYLRTGVAASTYQAKLNGTGFVKASGTSITYDNSTYLTTGTAASTYLPLTGGTTSGLITSSFTNITNYSTGATDNNAFTIYNNTTSTNNIYGGLQFLIGANSGSIPGGPGLAQIYAIRAGGSSNPSTDLTFSTKSNVDGVLEKMRIKFDGKVGIGTSSPSYLLDVNGQIGSTGFIKSGGTSSQFLKADGSVDNNTYLTTSSASSTYLPLTGGTLTGGFAVNAATVLNGIGANNDTRIESDNNTNMFFVDASTDRVGIGTNAPTNTLDVNGSLALNGTLWNFNNVNNRNGYLYFDHSGVQVWKFGLFNDNTSTLSLGNGGNFNRIFNITNNGNIGINDTTPSYTLDVNGTLGVTGAATLGSTLAVTGNITEAGNNVLTSADTTSMLLPYLRKVDTASLSNRINAINSGGNQIANNNNSTQTISNLGGLSNYYLWINNPNTVTITLPSPSLNNNKMITIKNTDNGAVFSASSNVQPLVNPTPPATLVNTNVILASGGGKWTTMVSNGFEWVKMAGN